MPAAQTGQAPIVAPATNATAPAEREQERDERPRELRRGPRRLATRGDRPAARGAAGRAARGRARRATRAAAARRPRRPSRHGLGDLGRRVARGSERVRELGVRGARAARRREAVRVLARETCSAYWSRRSDWHGVFVVEPVRLGGDRVEPRQRAREPSPELAERLRRTARRSRWSTPPSPIVIVSDRAPMDAREPTRARRRRRRRASHARAASTSSSRASRSARPATLAEAEAAVDARAARRRPARRPPRRARTAARLLEHLRADGIPVALVTGSAPTSRDYRDVGRRRAGEAVRAA